MNRLPAPKVGKVVSLLCVPENKTPFVVLLPSSTWNVAEGVTVLTPTFCALNHMHEMIIRLSKRVIFFIGIALLNIIPQKWKGKRMMSITQSGNIERQKRQKR